MIDEKLKQVALRLCGMTFTSHREYCVYKRSSLYKRDWNAARTGKPFRFIPGEEPEDVKQAMSRLLRAGFKTWEDYEAYWGSDARIRDCILVRIWETITRTGSKCCTRMPLATCPKGTPPSLASGKLANGSPG